jgi:hypothetical protein
VAPPIPLYAPEPVLTRLIGLEDDGVEVVRRTFDWHPLEAGEAAAAAGARRLLLTHFWPDNDRQASRADAAAAFRGEILLADEGLAVSLGSVGPAGPAG